MSVVYSPVPDHACFQLTGYAAANSDIFVTGDKALLTMKDVEGMAILSPRGFWERLRQRGV